MGDAETKCAMKRLLKVLLAAAGLVGGWLYSRGATNPKEWPKRLPKEISALWDDLDEAMAAGRRAATERERAFDQELGRRPPAEHD